MFQDTCVPDFIIKPKDIDYMRGYHQLPGVYILFAQREPLYVGKSRKLYYRLKSHFNGHSTNTSEYINSIDEIGLHFTFNIDYTEMAYITEYNPPLNVNRTKWQLSYYIRDQKYPKWCKGYSKQRPDMKCRSEAHTNGYCGRHGGNGIPVSVKADEEADDIIKNNLQLKFII